MNVKLWSAFGICVSLFMMSMFYRSSSAIIALDLSRDLKLSPQDLGILGSAFFYSFALIQLPLGIVLDRVGPRATMTVLNIIGVGGAIFFARAQDLCGGVIGRSLLGLGMAANLMGPFKVLSDWFDPNKFATFSGLILSIGAMGSLAATSPLAIMVQILGWRKSFLVLAGLNAFLVVLLLVFIRGNPVERGDRENGYLQRSVSPSILESLKTLFSSWSYWAISLSAFLRYGSFSSIQALWIGPFLMTYLGFSSVMAGNLVFMLNLGFILGAPMGGLISERIIKSKKNTILIGLVFSAAATISLSQWQPTTSFLYLLGGLLLLLGFFNSFAQITYSHIREIMPSKMSGTAMTGINFFIMMGAGLFVHALGVIVEIMTTRIPDISNEGQAYGTAFLICSMAFLAALVLYITTRDTRLTYRE